MGFTYRTEQLDPLTAQEIDDNFRHVAELTGDVMGAKDETEAARDAAVTAKNAAQSSASASASAKNAAEQARDTATQKANAASQSAAAASSSATAAQSAKDTAVTARNDAQSAASAAATSKSQADAAKNTAVNASNSATAAKTASESARDAAIAARNTAQSSATASVAAKESAESARDTASSKATQASSSATSAGASAAAAANSQAAAKTSQTEAASSAQAAVNAKNDAASSKSAAASSASAAKASQTVAETARSASESAKQSAESARDSATSSKNSAASSASSAQSDRQQAQAAAQAASSAQQGAQASAQSAADSASEAASIVASGVIDDSKVATNRAWSSQKASDTFLSKGGNLSGLTNKATARSNLGLGNVSNTSDADKPVSTATQAALNAKLGASANAASATKLNTSRTLRVDLASTTAREFDGTANVTNIGATGTLPVSRGGTGGATQAAARTGLGLGSAAIANLGTGANSAARGNHTHSNYWDITTTTGYAPFKNLNEFVAGQGGYIRLPANVNAPRAGLDVITKQQYGSNDLLQIAFPQRTVEDLYMRTKSADGWNSWMRFWHDKNFNPSSKQDKLTAGSNVTISGSTISATDTKYSVMSAAEMEAGTSTTGRLVSAKGLAEAFGGGGLGIDQTWVDVTSVRLGGVMYTNTTERPIMVNLLVRSNFSSGQEGSYPLLKVGGISLGFLGMDGTGRVGGQVCAIVPPGATYIAETERPNNYSIQKWAELR